MEDISKSHVYHGSQEKFDLVVPKKNKRVRKHKNGETEIIFDGVSFHATPYKWIALAYTYDPKVTEINGEKVHYNMGVDLYNHNKEVEIYGVESLEESLKKLYRDGGYIYHFDKNKFYYTEGLGNLEVIVQESIEPETIERIDDPVSQMRKLGVTFKFIDLALPENIQHRDYKR